MSRFKTTEGFSAEAKGKKVLHPDIYEGTIKSVIVSKKVKYNAPEGDEGDTSIDIEFKDSKTGKPHLDQTTEPKPTDNSTQEVVDTRMFERMLHIASPFLTIDELGQLKNKLEETENFDDFAKTYADFLNPKVGKTEIVFKVVGSVFKSNNGMQTSAKIPNFSKASSMYPVVIRKDKGTLAFSKSDKENNLKYWELINSQNSAPAAGEGAASKPEDDTLFDD